MRSSFLLIAVLLVPAGAAAQHPGLDAPALRPLHVQLADANAAAIARVAEVALGRIRVDEAHAVLGAPPTHFELKRAPSAPPPLAPGDRALLLLRGARTPFLLASEPHELIQLSDGEDVDLWTSGLRGLHDAKGEGPALVRAYARWLGGPERLQREAAIGLAHEDCPDAALAPVAERLVERALASEDAELRQAAARAAVRTEEGREQLLARLPTKDAQVLVTALIADGGGSEAARETLLRALRYDDASIRGAALRFTPLLASDREVRAQLVRIASEDPDAKLQERARRIMKAGAE